jgi:hypothetical protein
MHIRSSHSADPEEIELTTENGGLELGGEDGTVTIRLTAVQTAGMGTPGVAFSGVYDIELVSGTGVVVRLCEGDVEMTPEATR